MISKHLIFGNLGKEDVKLFIRKFLVIMDKFRNSMPSYKLTYRQQMLMDNLELIYRSILTRAVGETRERVLQNTQVRQQITTSDFNKPVKQGFFSRVFGFGGRKGK